jgi:hypothetical protein
MPYMILAFIYIYIYIYVCVCVCVCVCMCVCMCVCVCVCVKSAVQNTVRFVTLDSSLMVTRLDYSRASIYYLKLQIRYNVTARPVLL